MATPYNGLLNATQIQLITDQLSASLDLNYANLGLGLPGETGTSAAQAATLSAAILGDGTTSNPGLGNSLTSTLALYAGSLLQRERWDTVWSQLGQQWVGALDSNIIAYLPSGWTMTSATSPHPTNNWISRLNGAHTGVPTTPASAGVLTAAAGGGIATCSAGNGPRVVHTLVGANMWDESLPSAEATQAALAGANNSYTYQIASTVPVGTTYVRIYRGYVAGLTSIYYLDSQTAVTAGAAYPAIVVTQPDSALRQDIVPPSWLSCLLKPQAASIIALAYAVSGPGGVQPGVPLSLQAANMVSESNVALGPSNGFLGLANNAIPSTGVFGTRIVGTSYTQGAIKTANDATSGIQGFAGSTKLQARVTSALNAAGTSAPTYSYYDAAHGWGSAQSATASAATFTGTAVGSTATYTITAGRLVTAVTAETPAGIASGTYLIESPALR